MLWYGNAMDVLMESKAKQQAILSHVSLDLLDDSYMIIAIGRSRKGASKDCINVIGCKT